MSVAKVIEISASSTKSFEDAINIGISRATDSVGEVCGTWVKGQKVTVSGGKIKEYRVSMQVTFLVRDSNKS